MCRSHTQGNEEVSQLFSGKMVAPSVPGFPEEGSRRGKPRQESVVPFRAGTMTQKPSVSPSPSPLHLVLLPCQHILPPALQLLLLCWVYVFSSLLIYYFSPDSSSVFLASVYIIPQPFHFFFPFCKSQLYFSPHCLHKMSCLLRPGLSLFSPLIVPKFLVRLLVVFTSALHSCVSPTPPPAFPTEVHSKSAWGRHNQSFLTLTGSNMGPCGLSSWGWEIAHPSSSSLWPCMSLQGRQRWAFDLDFNSWMSLHFHRWCFLVLKLCIHYN